MFPAASVKIHREHGQLASAQRTGNGCKYVLVFGRKIKNILKSGIIVKALSHRSNTEVAYNITITLTLTHSTLSQRQMAMFSKRKGQLWYF